MSLFILTKAAHQEKLSNLGLCLHGADVAGLIISVGAWAQSRWGLCRGCPWLSRFPSVLPGASSSGAARWLWCCCQQPAHLQCVPCRWCHLTSTVCGARRRWAQNEERIHTGLRKPKAFPEVRWFPGARFGNPFLPLPWGYQAWRWHSGLDLCHSVSCSAREHHSYGAA